MKNIKGTWKGIFADPREKGRTELMELKIENFTKGVFSGTTHYPTEGIGQSVKGMIDGTAIYFVEYENLDKAKVKGLIPNTYQGHILGDCISGTSLHGDMQGTFYLAKK